METILGIFAVVVGLVHDLVAGLNKWLEGLATNGIILVSIWLAYYYLSKSFETRIDRLRDLINGIEDRRRCN